VRAALIESHQKSQRKEDGADCDASEIEKDSDAKCMPFPVVFPNFRWHVLLLMIGDNNVKQKISKMASLPAGDLYRVRRSSVVDLAATEFSPMIRAVARAP
jgi:hypothetical protein